MIPNDSDLQALKGLRASAALTHEKTIANNATVKRI